MNVPSRVTSLIFWHLGCSSIFAIINHASRMELSLTHHDYSLRTNDQWWNCLDKEQYTLKKTKYPPERWACAHFLSLFWVSLLKRTFINKHIASLKKKYLTNAGYVGFEEKHFTYLHIFETFGEILFIELLPWLKGLWKEHGKIGAFWVKKQGNSQTIFLLRQRDKCCR